MYADNQKRVGVAIAAIAVMAGVLALLAFQVNVNLAYASNQIAPNVILTESVTSTCQIALSTSALTFGNVIAGTNTITTTNSVTDTNNGNAGTYPWVYGSTWQGGASSFGVTNTVWSSSSSTAYGLATQLTLVAANTQISAGASGGTAVVYFGLGIPEGQPANTYTQNIIITNVC